MSAVIHHLREAKAPSLDALHTVVAGDMALVNSVLLARMQSPVVLIPELAGHLIASGGKRVRPMLTLACCRLLGCQSARAPALAAAVELIHTATLLHDDVVDDSAQRRGVKTANIIWGNQSSVLVGDFLFSRAFELMVEDGSLRVLKILSHASAVIAQGEVDQLTTTGDLRTTEERYLEVVAAKTAALFAAACQIAAVIAERDGVTEAALEAFGRYLGVAFQLVDDALDYRMDNVALDKDIGDDFREGKLTLPVILAYQRADTQQRQFWQRVIGHKRQQEGDLEQAMALIAQTGAGQDTLTRARYFADRAASALADFPDSDARAALLEAVTFTLSRAY